MWLIVSVSQHESHALVELLVGGERLRTTPEHPFLLGSGEWQLAGHLQVGDELLRSDRVRMPVREVRHETEHTTRVYNFEVADWHTYLVGYWMLVVHNMPNPHVQAPMGQPELAEVIDLRDPERLGRLRLRYQWPVARAQEVETDWVRATTPYSGDGKGQLFSPELGSQVLVGYEQHRAEQPVVLGNLVHGNNAQKAKYSPESNSLKGLQTAGGNKFVMQDAQGAQKITISNSNNKGSAIEVNFAGDGSISIQSRGPVSITGANVTVAAGPPAKGAMAYTGEIKLLAKTITLEAEEEVAVTSKTKGINMEAEEKLTLKAKDMKGTFCSEIAINASSKIRIKSPDSDII